MMATVSPSIHVHSPTFTIINRYDDDFPIYHLDLYRLESDEELYQLDIQGLLERNDHALFIEWAEKLGELMPDDAIHMAWTFPEHPQHEEERCLKIWKGTA